MARLHNSSKFLQLSIFEGSGGGGNSCFFKAILSAEVCGFVEVLKDQSKKYLWGNKLNHFKQMFHIRTH